MLKAVKEKEVDAVEIADMWQVKADEVSVKDQVMKAVSANV